MASKRIDWKTLEPALRKLKKDELLHVLRDAYEAQRLPQQRRQPPRCMSRPGAAAAAARRRFRMPRGFCLRAIRLSRGGGRRASPAAVARSLPALQGNSENR